ncbi:hypothetical protein R1sor_014687 [Riccia sorocarpa]|uniref:Uncharacterized protein n=1 Tax=Riccia sorocarpa TaxID=122646 RepID=A0ABD3HAD1_9MARC
MEVEEHKGTHSEGRAPEVETAGENGEFHPEGESARENGESNSEVRAPEVESAGEDGEIHPEVTSPGRKEKLVRHIKEKLVLVKDKIIGYAYTPPHSPHGDRKESLAASSSHEDHDHTPSGGCYVSTLKACVVSQQPSFDYDLAFDDADEIPNGGLFMTAAPEEPEAPTEQPHGLKKRIMDAFDFPVPDTTVTPTKDFEETAPPDLKRMKEKLPGGHSHEQKVSITTPADLLLVLQLRRLLFK